MRHFRLTQVALAEAEAAGSRVTASRDSTVSGFVTSSTVRTTTCPWWKMPHGSLKLSKPGYIFRSFATLQLSDALLSHLKAKTPLSFLNLSEVSQILKIFRCVSVVFPFRLRVLDAAVAFQECLTSMESKLEAESAAAAAAPWPIAV